MVYKKNQKKPQKETNKLKNKGFFKVFFKKNKKNKKMKKIVKETIIVEPPEEKDNTLNVEQPKKVIKASFKIRYFQFLNKIKIRLNKINNKVKLWYSKRKTLQALVEIIGKILFDGLLISIPYWVFVDYNLYTIFAFGSALMVFKKQLLPIILKILNSFSIVKVNNK